MHRNNGRRFDELRDITIETNVTAYAEGSCLVKFGNTHVICTATLDDNVPGFLKNKGTGWVTAEYGMLPRSTHQRMRRESSTGKQTGRTMEIQRLISRALRSVVDLGVMGERQIIVDCDVIQADGGTRTASITGGFVALYQACTHMVKNRIIRKNPIITEVAAVSCGIYEGKSLLDLDYVEDSGAEVDANFIMTGNGGLVEIQATAEESSFSEEQFNQMLSLSRKGIKELIELQRQALKIISYDAT